MATPYDDAAATLQDLSTANTNLVNEIARLEGLYQAELMKTRTPTFGGGFNIQQSAPSPHAARLNILRTYREKHNEWGRKIHGIMMGYQREMQSAHNNLIKGRDIGFAQADVTVGTNEIFAKAIQHKHTVSTENSAVNEMIAKAANQLTGESGEAPLATQRKIIDVMINDRQNWWPFNLSDFSSLPTEGDLWKGIIPLDLFKMRGEEQILAQLVKYKKGKSGLNSATLGTIGLGKGITLSTMGKSSIAYSAPGIRADVLTIKIVFGQPRPFKNVTDGDTIVRKAVFIAYSNLKNTTLTVRAQSVT